MGSGSGEGCSVGAGVMVGTGVGLRVGLGVGFAVGAGVGVGFAVGTGVGFGVGEAEGLSVGAAEGEGVAAGVGEGTSGRRSVCAVGSGVPGSICGAPGVGALSEGSSVSKASSATNAPKIIRIKTRLMLLFFL